MLVAGTVAGPVARTVPCDQRALPTRRIARRQGVPRMVDPQLDHRLYETLFIDDGPRGRRPRERPLPDDREQWSVSQSNGYGLPLRAALHATKARQELALRAAHAGPHEHDQERDDVLVDDEDIHERKED